ncbi:uncharacterized protein DS421_5g163860 [Arachis hypogaea]|nr:uncharacterized protein DS421_5g163860 [Arachis hypogaea]
MVGRGLVASSVLCCGSGSVGVGRWRLEAGVKAKHEVTKEKRKRELGFPHCKTTTFCC